MHSIIACATNLDTTLFAFANLPALFHCNMVGLDPFATAFRRTVDSIAGCVFLKLPVPGHFELLVEQFVDMLQRYVIRRATFRRHVGWIGDGHGKDSLKASVTHAMAAC